MQFLVPKGDTVQVMYSRWHVALYALKTNLLLPHTEIHERERERHPADDGPPALLLPLGGRPAILPNGSLAYVSVPAGSRLPTLVLLEGLTALLAPLLPLGLAVLAAALLGGAGGAAALDVGDEGGAAAVAVAQLIDAGGKQLARDLAVLLARSRRLRLDHDARRHVAQLDGRVGLVLYVSLSVASWERMEERKRA